MSEESDLKHGVAHRDESIGNPEAFQQSLVFACKQSKELGQAILFGLSIPFDTIDPLALLEQYGHPNQAQFFWDNAEQDLSIAAGEALITLRQNDNQSRFDSISAQIAVWKERSVLYTDVKHSLSGPLFLGGFSFFDETQEQNHLGNTSFIVPVWCLVKNGHFTILNVCTLVQPEDTVEHVYERLLERISTIQHRIQHTDTFTLREFEPIQLDWLPSNTNYDAWEKGILEARSYIRNGYLDKVVLARDFQLKSNRPIVASRLVHSLRRNYPSCYTFLFQLDGESTFLGSTPERLAAFKSNFVLTEGLAGSSSRGKTATEDSIQEKKLLNSQKDLQEHRFVVEAIRHRLSHLATEITVPKYPSVKKFANVQHLHTPISAWLKSETDPFAVLGKLHPTPAVGGTPHDVAIPLISKIEQFERGWYAGPIGWMGLHGSGEFAVGIRSGVIKGTEATFYAGCGIVADSDPSIEWDETNLKLIPMRSAIEHA